MSEIERGSEHRGFAEGISANANHANNLTVDPAFKRITSITDKEARDE